MAGPDKAKAFDALTPLDLSELTLEAEVTYGDEDAKKEYRLLMLHLEGEYKKRRLEEKMAELHRAEKGKEKGGGDISGLMQEIQALSKRIQEIKAITEKI